MILIEKTETYGWEAAIRGMRNPKNSWDNSDSGFCKTPDSHCTVCEERHTDRCVNGFVVGNEDYRLMKTLAAAGTDHGKFLRMIAVTMDVTAPFYWWKEFDTYKVGTVADSCSTMHKIHAKKFTENDFSCEHLDSFSMRLLRQTIDYLNKCRENYVGDYGLINGEQGKKDMWWQMIQLLPTSYNQKRTISLNYAVLKNIYHARKNHKLDEWHVFCDWIEQLPYSKLITE